MGILKIYLIQLFFAYYDTNQLLKKMIFFLLKKNDFFCFPNFLIYTKIEVGLFHIFDVQAKFMETQIVVVW